MHFYKAKNKLLILPGIRHATYRDARGVTHSYFFSWEHAPTKSLEVDWLDARNICRRHCMDAVSLETPQENEFVKQRISRGKNNNTAYAIMKSDENIIIILRKHTIHLDVRTKM